MAAGPNRRVYRSCTLCEATCGVAIDLEEGQITSIRGDRLDPSSRGYVCPKVMGLKDVHEDPDRLRVPLRRRGNDFEPIPWDAAFDLVADKLRDIRSHYGSDAIGVYQGNPSAHNLGLATFGQLFLRRLGTRNLYSATSADQLPHLLSSLLMFGHQLVLPVPDIDHTDFLLIFGANPVVSNGSLMTAPNVKARIAAIRERGGRVIVVDPRRTETAACATEHLFVRPGTDALVMLAMLHTLFEEELVRRGRLEQLLEGEPLLREAAAPFSPERIATRTAIPAETIRRLARDIASSRTAVCYGRIGVSTQEFGGLCSWLINLLNLLTDNFDCRGGAMFPEPSVDFVSIAWLAGHRGHFDRFQSRVRGLPEFGGELPVSVLAEEIDTPGPGQIRALITSAGNPVLSIPNGTRLERALPELEFMVSIDLYLNETTRHADVILPPTFALERDHYNLAFSMLSVRNVTKYSPAVFERGPDQRHDWEICLELASRLESPPGRVGQLVGDAIRGIGRRVAPKGLIALGLRTGPHDVSMKELEQEPHGVDFGPMQPRLPELLHTPKKNISLAPRPYLEDLPRLEATLERPNEELLLIGRRQLRSNNSWLHNSARLVKGKPRCTLLMHPRDASARELNDGALVHVASRVGGIDARLVITDEMMPGVVSVPHGWGHDRPSTKLSVAQNHPGVSVNDITDEQLVDELSGNSRFSGVPVKIIAAEKLGLAKPANSLYK